MAEFKGYGFIDETDIAARNVGSYNRYGVGSFDIAGGGLAHLVAPTKQGEDRWTMEMPTAETVKNLFVAYNPSLRQLEAGAEGRLRLAGVSIDPRDFKYFKNETVDFFKPKVGDQITVSIDCFDDTGAAAVRGDFVQGKAGQYLYTRIPEATGATAGVTAFQVEWVGTKPFPKAGIGMDYVKMIKLVCVQE